MPIPLAISIPSFVFGFLADLYTLIGKAEKNFSQMLNDEKNATANYRRRLRKRGENFHENPLRMQAIDMLFGQDGVDPYMIDTVLGNLQEKLKSENEDLTDFLKKLDIDTQNAKRAQSPLHLLLLMAKGADTDDKKDELRSILQRYGANEVFKYDVIKYGQYLSDMLDECIKELRRSEYLQTARKEIDDDARKRFHNKPGAWIGYQNERVWRVHEAEKQWDAAEAERERHEKAKRKADPYYVPQYPGIKVPIGPGENALGLPASSRGEKETVVDSLYGGAGSHTAASFGGHLLALAGNVADTLDRVKSIQATLPIVRATSLTAYGFSSDIYDLLLGIRANAKGSYTENNITVTPQSQPLPLFGGCPVMREFSSVATGRISGSLTG